MSTDKKDRVAERSRSRRADKFHGTAKSHPPDLPRSRGGGVCPAGGGDRSANSESRTPKERLDDDVLGLLAELIIARIEAGS